MLVAVLAFYCGTAQLMEEAYGRAILPVWPLAEVTYCKPTWPSATLGKAYTSLKNMSPVKGRRDNRVDIEVSAV